MTELHRIAVIGAGGMGSFHARTLAVIPGCQVVSIADPFGDSVFELADELGAVASRDPESVATSDDVDALVIASPDETHADLTIAAMATGKRVLCEKPLATSVADAQRVVDAEVALGHRVVQLGFMREYDVPHQQVVEALVGDEPLHLIRSVHRNTNTEPRTDLGVIGQSIVHDFHSIRFVSGREIVGATAHATRRPDGSLRHVLVVCQLEGGGHGLVEFDEEGFAYEVLLEVTAGAAVVTTAGPVRAVERRDATLGQSIGRDWFGWFADAYRVQDAAWVRSLDDELASGPSTWDGLAAQVVVEAALESLTGAGRADVTLPPRPALYSA